MRIIRKLDIVPMLPKRKRVAAYARVSCEKETMLNSLSQQVSYFNDRIQRNPEWEFAGIYADEAKTGTKDNRPEFQRLLRDCRERKVDMILTKSISRFARNTVTMLESVRQLKDINVDVYFERENIHSLSGDGELMLTILSSFAQEESRSVSENKLWQIRKYFQEGKPVGFNGMYGYDYTDGQIVVNEAEATVIRQMFGWYIGDGSPADGMGATAIAQRLNEQGIPSYSGGLWNANRVSELLQNEKLTGNSLLQKFFTIDHLAKKQKRNRGEKDRYFVEGTHPAIIDAATFDTAQRIRKERAAYFKAQDSSGNSYPFSSIILCEHCGKKYKRKKVAAGFVWQCSTFLQRGKAVCPAKQIPEGTLMAVAAEVLGLEEFDGVVFKKQIDEIRVPGVNRLAFVFSDGKIVHREWQDRSRSESWTEEKRQEARERALRGGRGGASQ